MKTTLLTRIQKLLNLGFTVKLYSDLTGETTMVKIKGKYIFPGNGRFKFDENGYYIDNDGNKSHKAMLTYNKNDLDLRKIKVSKLPNNSVITVNNEELLTIRMGDDTDNCYLMHINGHLIDINDSIKFDPKSLNNDIDKFLTKLVNNCEVIKEFMKSFDKSAKIVKYYMVYHDSKYPRLNIEIRDNTGYHIYEFNILQLEPEVISYK